MISEQLEERAALYAVGALSEHERAQFELIAEFHEELRVFLDGLLAAAAAVEGVGRREAAPVDLKSRIMGAIDGSAQKTREDGFVMTGPDGLVDWVNPAFTAMCGYPIEELRGKKPGLMLQGELTDRATVRRLSAAVRDHVPCTESLVNYRKDGTPYWVSLNITPIHDDDGELLWMVAREVELTERALPA